MLTNDMRLVLAAQRGDRKAFTSLVRKHSPTLHLLALKLIHDPEDAREIVQDSLLKAYLHLSQFQGEARFSTWLGRITLNEALMRIRRRPQQEVASLEAHVSSLDQHPLASRIEDKHPDPEDVCRRAELGQIVRRAIHKLPPPYRSVFVLRHIQDYSTRETAEILGVSVTAVKTRLRRARVELRRRLHSLYPSGYREGRREFGRSRCRSRGAFDQRQGRFSNRDGTKGNTKSRKIS